MFYAHSTAAPDKRDWQGLSDHLNCVAARAGAFGRPIGIERAATLAGMLHDLGKYNPAFQAYIAKAGSSVDHSTAGAALVGTLADSGNDRTVAELVAYAIAGHHAGLPDRIGPVGSLDQRIAAFDVATLDPVWRTEIKPEATQLLPGFDFGDRTTIAFRLAFLGRAIFACLVDADRRDTERFYDGVGGYIRDREWRQLTDLLPEMIAAFDRHMSAFASDDRPVNRLRREILDHVRSRAPESRGLFTLTVPTGGGKTLTSLGFALDHARHHGHSRIIYAIPFTSITEQTAAIFGDVLGAENILEHHSAIDEEPPPRRGWAETDKLKLAMEDWAAPVVVTTNVQFFESLFSARPSRARKLHNIANAVIILDEAQTLPRPLLAPCVEAIDELARNYGCTIVLCTATQPALDKSHFDAHSPLKGLPLAGRELAPDPPRLARALRRVTIRRVGAMDNAALVSALAGTPQGLIIVNTRRHALDLFRAAEAAGLEGVMHLTTRQYAVHRRRILADVRQRLKDGLPCRVVATSLVEAGVDVDFPCAWRAEAGLDQLMQAAGRVNREGRRRVEDSIVTFFSAPDYPPPPEIRGLIGDMARVADKSDDLQSLAAIEEFFREVYWRLDADVDRHRILQQFRVDRTGTNFAYRTVGDAFRMIESGMAPVIVAGDEIAKAAIAQLEKPHIPSGTLARALQGYVVQVPPRARDLLLDKDKGHVRFAAAEERGNQFAVLETEKLYDAMAGLLWEESEEYRLVESWVL